MYIDFNELRNSKKNIKKFNLKYAGVTGGALLGVTALSFVAYFLPIWAAAIIIAPIGAAFIYVATKLLSDKTIAKANDKNSKGLKLTKLEKIAKAYEKFVNNEILDNSLIKMVKLINKGTKENNETYYSLAEIKDGITKKDDKYLSVAESNSLSWILEHFNDKVINAAADLRSKKEDSVSIALGVAPSSSNDRIAGELYEASKYFDYIGLSINSAEEANKILAFTSDYLKEVKRAESYDKMLAGIAKIVQAQDQNIVEVKPEVKKPEIVQQEFKSTKSNEETENKEKIN